MASAQVISNPAVSSRKKKDLEAGRRRLEEFRKKKAAAKKAVSSSQLSLDDTTPHRKHTSENEKSSVLDSANALTDDNSSAVTGAPGFSDHNDKSHNFSHNNGSESVPCAHVDSKSDDLGSSDFREKMPQQALSHEIPDIKYQTDSNLTLQTEDSFGYLGADTSKGRYADVISSRSSASQGKSKSDFHFNLYGFGKDISNTNVSTNDFAAKAYAEGLVTNLLHQESDPVQLSNLPASTTGLGHGHLDLKNHFTSGLVERKPNVVGDFENQKISEPHSVGFNSNVDGLFNGPSYSAAAESYPRRSRPSFLDSLRIKDSSVFGRSFVDEDKLTNSELPSGNVAAPSSLHIPSIESSPGDPLSAPLSSNPSEAFIGNVSKGHLSYGHSLESKLEFTLPKQNEDFAALEQHIEDLTQEKFSLQRTLEASKVLAESLAAENSSLTESYNQQASIVNQLKDEMESLQAEIKSRLVELEAIKAEYMNAQLECNAADERAKLLASEVISLEEKALRLRSNELKLERELESSSAEIISYKKKMSSLDKERQDLLQTIDALQEEKKLLQSKMRRASASGIPVNLNNGHTKKDASTSTNDLGHESFRDSSTHTSSNLQMPDNMDNSLLLHNSFSGHEDFSMSIPPDQVQLIQNINSLITEITSEKEELMQALIAEVSTCTKLKELNKDLSQKLEIQTQRLELLTSQNMASENIATKEATGSHIVRESVAYADEGDEVVERVLGWIMKLFPGGPAKRRTSRL
ncbi:unnamed protein product [Amaranthus hypochondriacus]